jgi:hypothetical protein
MIATLSTSSKLEEWNDTAEISLACEIKETLFSRNWNVYGFNHKAVRRACSQQEANQLGPALECTSDCFWHPLVSVGNLNCETEGFTFETLAEIGTISACDCPCARCVFKVAVLYLIDISFMYNTFFFFFGGAPRKFH